MSWNISYSATLWLLFTLEFVQRELEGTGTHDREQSTFQFCLVGLQLFFCSRDQNV